MGRAVDCVVDLLDVAVSQGDQGLDAGEGLVLLERRVGPNVGLGGAGRSASRSA
jgi:hypothetical protein